MKKRGVLVAIGLALAAAGSLAVLFLSRRADFAGLRGGKDLNVIVITLDTCRADRLGCYGFSLIQTPTIDGFAERGVRFEDCIAQTPLTLPSHTSLFTGTLPFFHGVRDNGGFVVPPELKTMAEVFKDGGYATAAFIAAYVLDSKWGLAQGFDTYYDRFDLSKFEKISLDSVQRPANEVIDEALKWLEANKAKRFFTWIHLYDPHTPYQPPEPFKSTYSKNPYLGEIAFADSQLARLWSWLEGAGLVKNSILVFAGDHGESLGEHRESTHGFFVYQAAVHVPLIFVTPFPKLQRVSSAAVVSLIDVMPTVLEMAGLPRPPEVQGQSLVPLFFHPGRESSRYAYSETYYPRYHFGWSELRSFQDARHKLIIAPERELYDLAADPREGKNLGAVEAKTLAGLEAAAARFTKEFSRNSHQIDVRKIDEETRERLAALGYTGSFTDSAKLEGKKLANPRDKIGVFNELSRARELGMSGRAEEATAIIKDIIAADPDIGDAYFTLGNIYFKQRKFREAIPYFEKALERKPDDTFCVINIANSYLNMGRPAEGVSFVIDYMRKGFLDSQLFYLLGQLSYIQKKYDEAIKYYDECLSRNPESAASHNAMAAIFLIREDLAQAERHVNAALAINPRLTNLNYNRAELLEKQGHAAAAADAYKLELETNPRHFRASYNLSRVCRELGREAEEEKYLKLTMDINPAFGLSYFYLARLYLNRGENFEEAIRLVKQGIELKPEAKDLPLGYFLLADLYSRIGDSARAAEYARRGQELTNHK
jgi:arylsulfatase A-like enzyme/predicted Zn-dependent protease